MISFLVRQPGMERSVIRRSLVLLGFVVPGFLMNYLLLYAASRFLPLEQLGIFYTAISVINVLAAPAIIFGLFYARHFALVLAHDGRGAAGQAFHNLHRDFMVWGSLLALVVLAGLLFLGDIVHVESFVLLIFITGAGYSYWLVEVLRAGYQGFQQFVPLGLIGLAVMGGRLVLAVLGLWILDDVWAGVAGIMMSSFLAFAVFRLLLPPADRGTMNEDVTPGPALSRLLLFMAGFSVFAVITYIDVLYAYLAFDGRALGFYTASSVLPKALVLVSMPVVQVLFPVLVSDGAIQRKATTPLMKGAVLTLAVAGGGALGLLILRPLVCGGVIGVQSCQGGLMAILLPSIVLVCLLRVLVLYCFSWKRDVYPLLQLIPLAVYALWLWAERPGQEQLALSYILFSLGALIFYALTSMPWRTWLARKP